VRDAVHRDRGDPRVAHDDLRVAARRRVAGQRRLHVGGELLADLRDRLQQLERVLVRASRRSPRIWSRPSPCALGQRAPRDLSMRRKIRAQRAPTK
jgi:hypothetical protein